MSKPRLRLLRDLQSRPDNQAYLCHNAETAAKAGITAPFVCGCRRWLGGGVVRVEFYTPDSGDYMESDLVLIGSLEPIDNQTFTFNDPPW